uniref:Uncharacterized protein n=1 Tax=Arundo donax TaxID=35708 RepID=A0A0A9G821_ARUDO
MKMTMLRSLLRGYEQETFAELLLYK